MTLLEARGCSLPDSSGLQALFHNVESLLHLNTVTVMARGIRDLACRLGLPCLRGICCQHAVVMQNALSSCITFQSLRAVSSYDSVSRSLLVSRLRLQ
jgi:hypothetical protein